MAPRRHRRPAKAATLSRQRLPTRCRRWLAGWQPRAEAARGMSEGLTQRGFVLLCVLAD